jgi:hypothetical protein
MAIIKQYQVIVKVTEGRIKMDRFARHYIKNYLDELSKHKVPQTQEQLNEIQLNGIDYDSSMEQGRATLHGYLRDLYIEETQETPEQCTDHNILASNISKAVHLAGARFGRKTFDSEVAKKIVFSVSPEATEAWNKYHVDPDLALRHIVVETFNRYRIAVMDNAEIGYAIGIHHDKEHYHAHVILMEFTKTGKRLKLSNRQQVKQPDGSIKRIDHLNCIIGTANSVFCEYQGKHIHGLINMFKENNLVNQVEKLVNCYLYTSNTTSIGNNVIDCKSVSVNKVECTDQRRQIIAPRNDTEILNYMEEAYELIQLLSKQSKSPHGKIQLENAIIITKDRLNSAVSKNNEINNMIKLLRKQRRIIISESREQRILISALKYRQFPKWLASSRGETKTLNQLWYAHLALRGANKPKEKDGIIPLTEEKNKEFEADQTQESRVTRQQILELELDKAHLTELRIYLSASKVTKQQEIADQMRILTQDSKACKIIQDRLEISLGILEDARNNREPKILENYEQTRKNVEDAINCEEILRNQTKFPEPMESRIAPPTQEQSHDLPPAQIEKNQPIVENRAK